MTQPQQSERHGPRTWVVVLATLAAVVVVGLTFVGGLVTGIAISATPGHTTADSAASGSTAPPGPQPPAGAGDATRVDPCLVGTWRTVEHSESADTDQGKVTITGVDRSLEITADGTETITYGSTPAKVTTDKGEGTATYTGNVVYGITAQAGSMTFELRSADGTLSVAAGDGKATEQQLKPGTGAVTYTCSGDRFVQQATGFRSVLSRMS